MIEAEALALAQRDQLVAQWDRDCQFGDKVDSFIAFPDILNLESRAKEQGAAVTELKGHSGDAYVYEHHNGKRELWVRAIDKKTKAGSFDYSCCWNSFARTCGVTNPDIIGDDWQVDHVYPETSAARRKFQLVRAMPVLQKGNAGVGASLEAKLAKFALGEHKGGWIANWYTIAKVTGFQGTFDRTLIGDKELADQLIDHLLAIYPNLETWKQATVDDERKRLTETIASVRGRVLNVEGRNEGLKDTFLPAWTGGFSAGAHGRSNRTPKEFVGDARAAWKLGWAAGKAALSETLE